MKKKTKSPPRQISKTLTVVLFDEEVEVWQALHAYAIKKDLNIWMNPESKSASNSRLLREILRLAAETVARETDDLELPKKLAEARPYWRPAARPVTASAVVRKPGRPRVKKAPPKPTHRLVWNRPWGSRTGGT